MIKNEINRMFFSKGMLAAIVLGMALVLWQQYIYVWFPDFDTSSAICADSVYYSWIGGDCGYLQTFLFYFIIPLLAALPTGYTYFDDLHSGYVYQYDFRNVRTKYLTGKICATFLTGAFVTVVPLVFSFLVTAMKFPLLYPEPIKRLGPDAFSFDTALYYEHPLLHVILFICLAGIFSGGMALFVLTATFVFDHRFTVMITPFVIYYFLFSLDQILGNHDYSPNYFLIPGFRPHLWWEYAGGMIVFVLNIFLIYRVGKKR